MDYSELPDARISGSGKLTLPGYGALKISGSGRVTTGEINTSGSSTIPGGLRLGELKTSGSVKIEGYVYADSIRFSGSAHVEGALECEDFINSGSVKIGGNLKANYARLSGSAKVKGHGSIAREIEVSGSAEFWGDLISEDSIQYSGVMRVEGRVRARSFEARLSRDESLFLRGITSNHVDIQRSHEDWRNLGTLVTSDITGEEITLENVQCDNIKGKKITIRKGCFIKGKVEYSESIQVDPTSTLQIQPTKTEL